MIAGNASTTNTTPQDRPDTRPLKISEAAQQPNPRSALPGPPLRGKQKRRNPRAAAIRLLLSDSSSHAGSLVGPPALAREEEQVLARFA